jgi:predicted membrane protein (TIGR00267 family)
MKWVNEFRRYIRVTRLDEIARRYFVMNAFDGALTMLGILVGAYISGSQDVRVILSAGVGACIAMGMSGFAGAYMTEKAERIRKLKELEDAMLLDLDDTVYGKASRFASVFTALVDGLSPALAALLILSPFLLIKYGLVDYVSAYFMSTAVAGVTLFALGGYLAKISDESMLKYGLHMVVVGLVTAVVIFAVGTHSI